MSIEPARQSVINRLKLSEPQDYAILMIGAKQTLQESHGMVSVCRAVIEYGKDNYWTSSWSFISQQGLIKDQKSKAIRAKTFFTLETKGLIQLSEKDPSSANKYLRAQLTDLGWSVFGFLATKQQSLVTRWNNRLAGLIAQEEAKPKQWKISLTGHRKVMTPQYEGITQKYNVEASNQEEALRIAQEKFSKETSLGGMSYDSWYKTWRINKEVWNIEDYDADDAEEKEKQVLEVRMGESEVEQDEAYKRRASALLDAELPTPWRINGIAEYVLEGKLSPYLLEKSLEATGGIRLDNVMAKDEPVSEETAEDCLGMDMARFSMLDLD